MTLGRNATDSVSDLLAAFRLVVLGGARQTGKTTLVRELLGLDRGSRFSLDDEAVLRRAVADPHRFRRVNAPTGRDRRVPASRIRPAARGQAGRRPGHQPPAATPRS